MKKIIIIGASGFGREVLDVFMAQPKFAEDFEVLGFVDDDANRNTLLPDRFPLLGNLDSLCSRNLKGIEVISGIGSPATRLKVIDRFSSLQLDFATVIHPSVVSTPYVEVGKGTVITAGCILTNHIHLGDHVILNLDCTVGHDCVIEDYCTVAPGAHISGNVHIKRGADIGTGATIIQGVSIGEWAVIGAGAVVTEDVPANTVSVGVPAKVIKKRSAGWHSN